MRRPWIEGAVLLASAGFAAPPAKPLHPVARSLIMADKLAPERIPRPSDARVPRVHRQHRLSK